MGTGSRTNWAKSAQRNTYKTKQTLDSRQVCMSHLAVLHSDGPKQRYYDDYYSPKYIPSLKILTERLNDHEGYYPVRYHRSLTALVPTLHLMEAYTRKDARYQIANQTPAEPNAHNRRTSLCEVSLSGVKRHRLIATHPVRGCSNNICRDDNN